MRLRAQDRPAPLSASQENLRPFVNLVVSCLFGINTKDTGLSNQIVCLNMVTIIFLFGLNSSDLLLSVFMQFTFLSQCDITVSTAVNCCDY
jgi:hypothetical protein